MRTLELVVLAAMGLPGLLVGLATIEEWVTRSDEESDEWIAHVQHLKRDERQQ